MDVIEQDLRPLRDQVQSYIDTTNWEEWERNEQAIAESAINKSLLQSNVLLRILVKDFL